MGEWWGDASVRAGAVVGRSLGPLELMIGHRKHEWRVAWWYPRDAMSDDVALRETTWAPPDTATVVRCVGTGLAERLDLSVRLADRDVVVRPELPLLVPSGEEAILYVSTPVWAVLSMEAADSPLADIPCWRPSDTWFGASTREGELCYASRTSARVDLELLPRRATRAVTRVVLRNGVGDALVVERIKVPVCHLLLFAGEDGDLWTQGITLVRGPDQPDVSVEIQPDPPPEAGGARQLAEVRASGSPNILARALSALVG